MHRRFSFALAVVVLLQAAVAPVAAFGAPDYSAAPPDSPTLSPQALGQSNNTTTTTPNGTDAPSTAESVRITPVRMDEGFLSVTVAETDSKFNTSGPFALFSLSTPVESARITQSPAKATVLAGGQQVKVQYSDDAAPPDEQSLYTLELFFADGSTKTVELYATETDVSVAAADLKEYAPVIEELKELAEDYDYETNPDALLEFISYARDRLDLIDGWLTEQAARLMAGLMVLAMNPLSWVILLLSLAGFGYWLRSNFSEMLDWLTNDPGKAQRERDQLRQSYQNQRRVADEEPMREIDAVGSSDIIWESEFGVKSVGDLADLAAGGLWKRTADGGEEQVHGGIEDLSVEDLRTKGGWLEPVLRNGRMNTPERALVHLEQACRRMETEYNLGHIYREPADHAEQLVRDLREANRSPGAFTGGND
jgi:hypothetical protein